MVIVQQYNTTPVVIVRQYSTTPVVRGQPYNTCGSSSTVQNNTCDSSLQQHFVVHTMLYYIRCRYQQLSERVTQETGMFVSFLLPYHPYRFQRLYSHTAYSGILNPSHIHAPSSTPATSRVHPYPQPHPGYIPTPSHIQGTSLPPATSRVHPYP